MSEYFTKKEKLIKIGDELLEDLDKLNKKMSEYNRLSVEIMSTLRTDTEQMDLDDFVRTDEDCIKVLRLSTALAYVENPTDMETAESLLTDVYISQLDDEIDGTLHI